jgi:N-acetyl-anhydromuramyl-L-alanine amidase AmpD
VGELNLRDVRASMPGYERCRGRRREAEVTGIAVHHSAGANAVTGVSTGDALAIFDYHVRTLGWEHGGYHYLVHPTGLVEYALDEDVPAFHAGFSDPDDRLSLEHGQYWNRHLLAVCLLGWFDRDRVTGPGRVAIPNLFTSPLPAQRRALVALLATLARRHGITADAIKGHRELEGCRTGCPGANVDLEALRQDVARRLAEGGA